MGFCLSKLCCCRKWKRENSSSVPSPLPKDNPVFAKDFEDACIDNENHSSSDQHFSSFAGRDNVQSKFGANDGNNKNVWIAVALYDFSARTLFELSFFQGDEMQIILENDNDNWWDAQLVDPPYTKGVVPYNYVAKKGSVEAQPYFHGKLSRNEAEGLLSSAEIATFLVRASDSLKHSYVISVRDHPKVKHYLIYKDNHGYFIHATVKKETITLLIEYHKKYECGVIKKLGQVYCEISDDWEIERTLIKLEHELGSGSFGSVYKATYNRNIEVAVKTLKKGCLDSESFLKEADIMKRLIHPRIVRLYGVCTVGDPFYIVTELMLHGDLHKYLKKGNGQYLDLPQLVMIGAQVASGMAYLEYNRYVHRDLAARNVLVGENNLCKISDFGFARLTTQDDIYMASTPGIKVPIRWTAPEALTHQTYTVKSDVWSFGILLTEIIEKGMKPYPDISKNQDILPQLLQGYRMSHTLMPNCPDKLYDLMQACWEIDPKFRPSFADLFEKLENFYEPTEYNPYNT